MHFIRLCVCAVQEGPRRTDEQTGRSKKEEEDGRSVYAPKPKPKRKVPHGAFAHTPPILARSNCQPVAVGFRIGSRIDLEIASTLPRRLTHHWMTPRSPPRLLVAVARPLSLFLELAAAARFGPCIGCAIGCCPLVGRGCSRSATAFLRRKGVVGVGVADGACRDPVQASSDHTTFLAHRGLAHTTTTTGAAACRSLCLGIESLD